MLFEIFFEVVIEGLLGVIKNPKSPLLLRLVIFSLLCSMFISIGVLCFFLPIGQQHLLVQ